MEFVAPLARIDPIYKEEEEAFKVTDVKFTAQCVACGRGTDWGNHSPL